MLAFHHSIYLKDHEYGNANKTQRRFRIDSANIDWLEKRSEPVELQRIGNLVALRGIEPRSDG